MTARRSGRLYRDGPQPTEQYGRRNRAEKKETSRFQYNKKTESTRLGITGLLFPYFPQQ